MSDETIGNATCHAPYNIHIDKDARQIELSFDLPDRKLIFYFSFYGSEFALTCRDVQADIAFSRAVLYDFLKPANGRVVLQQAGGEWPKLESKP